MNKSIKVFILYSEIADYLLSCLGELQNFVDEIHLIHWPVNKEAPFKFNFYKKVRLYDKSKLNFDEIINLLKSNNPSIILCSGWMDNDYLKIVKLYYGSIPTILLLDNPWKSSIKQKIACLISPFFLKKIFSHVWVPGEIQVLYAKKLGYQQDKIRRGLYSANTNKFNKFREDYSESKNTNFPKVFLYVGRYVRQKGIYPMWKAFIDLQDEHPNDWELWCMGTGEEFENRIIHPKIKHVGFVQPNQMLSYLSNSGVYILPSLFEPWGVSVHEMAAAGFPLLLSDKVGSSEKFLIDGKNGYNFNSSDINSIKKVMIKVINLKDSELVSMGNESFKLSLSETPKKWSNTLLSFLYD